jgi:hypothetical protein
MERPMRIRDPIAFLALALLAGNAAAQPSEVALTCTNPWSGTTWQITIDYRTPAVDRNLAQLGPDSISWFDPKDGGNWTLNRKSGELVGRVASSTGGYFLRGRCALEASHGR